MRNFIIVVIALFILKNGNAQKHEIGVFLGATNAITDLGRTDYINPLPKDYDIGNPTIPINIGLLYRFNLNPHQTIRVNLNYTRFADNDKLAAEDYRYRRGAKYSQTLYEGSALFEYNFFPINSEQRRAHSPYIFGGIAAVGYNHPIYNAVNIIDVNAENGFTPVVSKNLETKFSYAIPFGAGYKYKFNYNWQAGIELGVRATFEDDIDMANAQREDFTFANEVGLTVPANSALNLLIEESNNILIQERQLGDPSNNDWYVFSGITLTYVFGRPACFCD